jgi:opacity protein-like surface antigen
MTKTVVSGMISFVAWTCLFSETGLAQVAEFPTNKEWEVEAFAGASTVNDVELQTSVRGSQQTNRTVGLNYASGYQVGLRITQNVGDNVAAYLEYSFANAPLTFTNLTPNIQSLSLGHSIQHFSYNVSYLPRNLQKRFRPYASAGAGAVLYHISAESREEAEDIGVGLRGSWNKDIGVRLHGSWKFALNAGGGFKYLVHDQFALTFNVKDQISGVPSYGLPRFASVVNGVYRPGISQHGRLNNWQFNIGAVYQWDD